MPNQTEWGWLNDGLDKFRSNNSEIDRAYRDGRVGEFVSNQAAAVKAELGGEESKGVGRGETVGTSINDQQTEETEQNGASSHP